MVQSSGMGKLLEPKCIKPWACNILNAKCSHVLPEQVKELMFWTAKQRHQNFLYFPCPLPFSFECCEMTEHRTTSPPWKWSILRLDSSWLPLSWINNTFKSRTSHTILLEMQIKFQNRAFIQMWNLKDWAEIEVVFPFHFVYSNTRRGNLYFPKCLHASTKLGCLFLADPHKASRSKKTRSILVVSFPRQLVLQTKYSAAGSSCYSLHCRCVSLLCARGATPVRRKWAWTPDFTISKQKLPQKHPSTDCKPFRSKAHCSFQPGGVTNGTAICTTK